MMQILGVLGDPKITQKSLCSTGIRFRNAFGFRSDFGVGSGGAVGETEADDARVGSGRRPLQS